MPPANNRRDSHAYAMLVVLALVSSCLFVATGSVATAQTTVLAKPVENNDFQEATLMYRGGQYDAALTRVDVWLKERPKDARGRFLRGMIFTQTKKIDEAAAIYNSLIQDFPELPEPYNNLAAIAAERGDYDKARELLDTAVRANPNFTTAHENLGDVHARLAAASYERALRLDASMKAVAAKLKTVTDMLPARAPVPSVNPGKPK